VCDWFFIAFYLKLHSARYLLSRLLSLVIVFQAEKTEKRREYKYLVNLCDC